MSTPIPPLSHFGPIFLSLNVHGTGLALFLVDGDSNPAKCKPLERRLGMKKKILVLNANAQECTSLCTLLNQHHFLTVPADSIQELENILSEGDCIAVILDLDTIPVSNRNLKELSIKYPNVTFLCISAKRFHPELQDAIRHHIYACLNKPVDPDELLFWIKSIYEEGNISDD
jgi:DNA-binding NtrC family response regulator